MNTVPDDGFRAQAPGKKRLKLRNGAGPRILKAAVWTVGAVAVLVSAVLLGLNEKLGRVRYEAAFPVSASATQNPSETGEPESSGPAEPSAQGFLLGAAELPYDSGGVFQLMLIGSDARKAGDKGRSDSMILVSMNRNTSKITVTSLLRDIYLEIPGVEEGNRLNAANAFGGPSLLLRTVRQNFGIEVNRYLSVDYGAFIRMIDRIGGVEAELSDEEIGVANGYIQEMNAQEGLPPGDGLLMKSGAQTLNGKQALSYARIRYVGNGDFDRTGRQRSILQNVFSKLKRQNVFRLNALMNEFLPDVATNLTKGELVSLILAVPSASKEPVEYCRIPADGTFSYQTVRGMSVLKIDLDKNRAELRKKIYCGE